MTSIFLRSSDDSEISDDRDISFNFKLPKDGKAIDISTIEKYKIKVDAVNTEVNNDHATPIPLNYNTRKIILDHVDYDTRKTFVDHVDYA